MPDATQIINGSASGAGAGSALMGSSVLGMIGSMVMNGINNDFQRNQNKENRLFALQQQQRQNEFNLNMWNRQNAYNSPSSQVQRLLAAGLNPNLAYGNLGDSAAQQLTSADAKYNGQASRFNDPFGDIPRNIQTALAEQRTDELHAEELENQRLKNTYQDLLNKRQKHDNDRAGVIDDQNDEEHEKTMRNLDESFANMQKQGQILLEQVSQEKFKTAIAEYRKNIEQSLADNELEISNENKKYAVNLNTMIVLQMATEKAKKAGIDLDNEGKKIDNEIKKYQKEMIEQTKDVEIIAKRMSLIISAYNNASQLGKKQMLDKALGFDVKFKDGYPVISGSAYLTDKNGKHLNKDTQKWIDGTLKKMRDAPGSVTESDLLKYAVEVGLLFAK